MKILGIKISRIRLSKIDLAIIPIYIMLFLIAGLLVSLWWQVCCHDNPPNYFESPIGIIGDAHQAGDAVKTNVSFCQYTDHPMELHRQIVREDFRLELPSVTLSLPLGCHSVSTQFVLPRILPSGEYHIEYDGFTQVNALASRHTEFRSEMFYVEGISE